MNVGLHSGCVSSCSRLNSVRSMCLKKKTVSWQIKIHELEHNLQEQRQRIEQLERKKVSWKTSAVSRKRSQTPEKEATSCKDVSEKKESCCTKYLGNGTVNSVMLQSAHQRGCISFLIRRHAPGYFFHFSVQNPKCFSFLKNLYWLWDAILMYLWIQFCIWFSGKNKYLLIFPPPLSVISRSV